MNKQVSARVVPWKRWALVGAVVLSLLAIEVGGKVRHPAQAPVAPITVVAPKVAPPAVVAPKKGAPVQKKAPAKKKQ